MRDFSDWQTLSAGWFDELARRGLSTRTIQARRDRLTALFLWLRRETNVQDLREVSSETLRAYLASFDERGLAPATREGHFAALRGLFRFLLDRGALLLDPTAGIRLARALPRSPRGALSSEEIGRLLGAARGESFGKRRALAILELLYSTALRLGECARLTLSDVDLARGLCFVRLGKGSRDRVVPLGAPACEALRLYLTERSKAATHLTGGALWISAECWCPGRPIGRRSIQAIVAELGRRAGIERTVTPHLFRHTAATHFLQGGAGIRHVQQFLGHARLSTTAGYTHLGFADLRACHQRAFSR